MLRDKLSVRLLRQRPFAPRADATCAILAIAAAALLAGCGNAATRDRTASTRSQTTRVTSHAQRATQRSLETLIATTRSGVVRVQATTCAGETAGTGFLIGHSFVATVEHVIDAATSVMVVSAGGKRIRGTVVGADAQRDVALIKLSRPLAGRRLTFATTLPPLGGAVAALGFPLGLPLSVSPGVITGAGRTIPIQGIERHRLLQTDAPVNPGNSGGPLLSVESRRVVGVIDLGTTQANGITFAVAADVARPLLLAWQEAPQASPVRTCRSVTTTSSTATTASSVAPGPSGGDVSGQDANGYNIGPGCSDDPANSLPGCSDSPSVPAGDPAGTCANGITVDRFSTSCGLAESVYANYRADGYVSGYSSERGRSYTFLCRTGGPGTTRSTICLSNAGAAELYVRWHR